MNSRTIFFISDQTGITAETLGQSLISQFDDIKFTQITLPFIDTSEKAQEAADRIRASAKADGASPILFGTIIAPEIRTIIEAAGAFSIDFVQTFIGPLEKELGTPSSHTVGRSHGVSDLNDYNTRIDAVNFSLHYDDGASTRGYQAADVILVGVSRCGKTPTCLYLAMHYGVRAANYPITEEDLALGELPKLLRPYKEKLVGLTIDPTRLHAIRSKRRPDSPYSNAKQCQIEVKTVERLYQQDNIPFINSTSSSIEEMAARILALRDLDRRLS